METKIVSIKKEKYTLYIGRKNLYYNEPVDSKWANKYVIGKDGTREEVIEKYRRDLLNNPKLLEDLHEIDGQILGCYCAPDFACHGEILIALRNAQKAELLKFDRKLPSLKINNNKKCSCIIAGSRSINDKNLIRAAIKESGFQIDELVCGMAKGVDIEAFEICQEELNIPIKEFPAHWQDLEEQPCKIKYNRNGEPYNILAGYNRNERMANYASHLIAIHNNSNGTLNMIKLAKEKGLIIYEKVING